MVDGRGIDADAISAIDHRCSPCRAAGREPAPAAARDGSDLRSRTARSLRRPLRDLGEPHLHGGDVERSGRLGSPR